MRLSGIWTREKLTYLEKYAKAFTQAMHGKWDRLVYIDLLAGPGRDKERSTHEEFNGSPLIALGVNPPFGHLFFGDKDPSNIDALNARISPADRHRVTIKAADCNALVDEVVRQLSGRTLGLAFVDPQGFEVNFRTLQVLAKRRIDVLYLFPSGIGIRRNLQNFLAMRDSPLDDFWGGKQWRQLPAAKLASGDVASATDEKIERSFVADFNQRVATAGFAYRDEISPLLTNTRNAPMYHLLFFSHDKLALKLWRGIKNIAPGGQRNLPFE